MNLTIKKIGHHRNGIGGAPFHAVLFTEQDNNFDKLAMVFEQPGVIGVIDLAQLDDGQIGFDGKAMNNCWRGDMFEAELRQAIANWQDEQESDFMAKHGK